MNHAVSWRISVTYCLLDTQAQHTFSNPPSINCLCCSLKTNRQVSTVPSPSPKKKVHDPLSQFRAAWCPLTPFLSQGVNRLGFGGAERNRTMAHHRSTRQRQGPDINFRIVWYQFGAGDEQWIKGPLVGCLFFFWGGGGMKKLPSCVGTTV